MTEFYPNLEGTVTFISDDCTVGTITSGELNYYFQNSALNTPVNLGDTVVFDGVYYNLYMAAMNITSKSLTDCPVTR